jgi:DNA-binding Lrp family transcriptional regulator
MAAARRHPKSRKKVKTPPSGNERPSYKGNMNNDGGGHLGNSAFNIKNAQKNNTNLDIIGKKDSVTGNNTHLLDASKNSLSSQIEITAHQGTKSEGRQREIDELDIKLLNLLQRGYDNKQIADKVDNPLSTIQRRTRLIFERGLAASKIEPDYAKLGLKKGYLILRLKGGKIADIVEMLQQVSGIISISANIGVFPLICIIIYRDTKELWNIISNVQELDNVKEVLWSEEVSNVTTKYDIMHFTHAQKG